MGDGCVRETHSKLPDALLVGTFKVSAVPELQCKPQRLEAHALGVIVDADSTDASSFAFANDSVLIETEHLDDSLPVDVLRSLDAVVYELSDGVGGVAVA